MKFIKITLAIFLGSVLLWACGLAAFAFFSLTRAPEAPLETSDAIVVLTGGKNRIEEGLRLFARGRASHLFITGVHEDVRLEDIKALWTDDISLPPCCITLGHEATTTEQNAQETRAWLTETGYDSLRLVTGNYHMPRALLEMRHALPSVTIYAHPVEQQDLRENHALLRHLLMSEYHKTLYRWAVLLLTPHGGA